MTNNKKLSDLNFDTKNANKHTAKGQKALEDSLQKYGAGRSILVDKNNNIIAGNLTAEVAGQIGLEDVQIVESDGKKLIVVKRTDIDINSKAGRELAISDNRASELSLNWDSDALKDIQENFKVDLSEFFSNKELKLLGLDNINLNEEDFEFPDEIKTDIVLGDLFEIGDHRLLCGDSTDSDQVAKLMNGQKADMVFTDPPYGMGYKSNGWDSKKTNSIGNKNDKKILGDENTTVGIDAIRLTSLFIKENVHLFFWCRWDSFSDFANAAAEFSNVKGNIVWDKGDAPGLGDLECSFGGNEMAVHSIVGRRKIKKRINSVWKVNRPKGLTMVHPTQKPIEIIELAIDNCTDLNDLILDLFLGSGSTMVASHQLNRKCYGMEIDPKYCQVILDRMLKLDPSLKIIKNGKHN